MSGEEPEGRAGEASGGFEPLTAGHLFFLLHHVVRQREIALGGRVPPASYTTRWDTTARGGCGVAPGSDGWGLQYVGCCAGRS